MGNQSRTRQTRRRPAQHGKVAPAESSSSWPAQGRHPQEQTWRAADVHSTALCSEALVVEPEWQQWRPWQESAKAAAAPAPAFATTEVPHVGVEKPLRSDTPWQKYSSIETSTTPKILRDFQRVASNAGGCEWVACEKVHGANFSFLTDGEGVGHASRNMRLGSSSDFYNCTETMPRYHPHVLQAFQIAKRRKPDLESMVIYGEYFGGYFPDLHKPKKGGLKTVQRGVAYSPDHHFYAFDVSLNGTGFLDFDDARELLLAAGFPLVASPLLRGTFEEVYSIDVEKLHTGLPALLGLLAPSSFYIAEGVVIRPAKELLMGGSSSGGGGRTLLKKKARAFWEATNQKEMAATQVPASLSGGSAAATMGQGVLIEARNFLTANRLHAVISKDPGLLRVGRESELAKAFTEDAIEDLMRNRDGVAEAQLGEDPHLRARLEELATGVIQARLAALRADHT